MIRRPTLSQLTETLFPYTPLFRSQELEYCRGLRFIKSDFVDFLGLFNMPEKCIKVSPGAVPGEIDITVKGPWLHTILFEIPVLAIGNEVYFRNVCKEPGWEEGRKRLQKKMRRVTGDPDLADFRVAEYGTRRRFSKVWHEEVLVTMIAQMGVHFAGTSTVKLPIKHGVTPLGTLGNDYQIGRTHH